MPTGYTYKVQDGTTTSLREYALECAKAFDIDQRDAAPNTPLATEKVASTYYKKLAADLRAELDDLMSKSDDEIMAEARSNRIETIDSNARYIAKKATDRERYQNMIALTDAWDGPTNLKNFMREQLLNSLEFDCGNYTLPEPSPLPSAKEIRTNQFDDQTRRIADAELHYARDVQRAAKSNEWLKQLYDSLKDID